MGWSKKGRTSGDRCATFSAIIRSRSSNQLRSPSASCATDGDRSRRGPRLLPESLIRRLATEPPVRSVEVVEVLPLLQPVIEQSGVVDHDSLEHPVELL